MKYWSDKSIVLYSFAISLLAFLLDTWISLEREVISTGIIAAFYQVVVIICLRSYGRKPPGRRFRLINSFSFMLAAIYFVYPFVSSMGDSQAFTQKIVVSLSLNLLTVCLYYLPPTRRQIRKHFHLAYKWDNNVNLTHLHIACREGGIQLHWDQLTRILEKQLPFPFERMLISEPIPQDHTPVRKDCSLRDQVVFQTKKSRDEISRALEKRGFVPYIPQV